MDSDPDITQEHLKEYEALVGLLLESARAGDERAPAVAGRIATGCLKPGHLWRGMGLESRAALRELFETHFPDLAAGNTKDMRWKKYLYKLLCGWPGFQG